MKKQQLDGSPAALLEFHAPWDRAREGRIPKQPTTIDCIHEAIAALEDTGSTNKAAEALAPAGGAACEVLKALYQVLPDQLKKGRTTTKNLEKEHVQTLLLTVCQEGLHIQAGRRLAEEQAQRRMTDYTEAEPDPKKYDPILDAFQKSEHRYVKVEVKGTDPQTIHKILAERIKARNLTSKIAVSLIGGTVYLEKT
ncbi:MAG: hypothetical protein ABIJ47_06065 [Candidatus Bathyarchaeota archaeon]